ncbi:MAG: hypothetical protein JXQ75_21555 [Phycisphaerae bacterium]|nr:hypothetical protein [Phycisphaerae bacterium]
MDTSAVGSSPVVTTQEPTSRGFNDLASEDFLALLIAELQSQDPMDPTDNKEIVAQMANMRQMEQSETLNETLKALASEQRFGATAALIGHYVAGTVTDDAGQGYELQGVVIGVRYQHDGQAILELHDGRSLPADKVEQVTLLENLPPEILEQLQEELNMLNEETDDGQGDSSTARLAKEDSTSGKAVAGDMVRQFGSQVDTVASLLDSLFAPRVSVGI